jgi:hypothetical protein
VELHQILMLLHIKGKTYLNEGQPTEQEKIVASYSSIED